MTDSTRVVHVPNDSELAHLLDEADNGGLRLEKDGILYRLVREGTKDAHPAAVREVVARLAGTLSEDEADRLVESLYRAREAGSRPSDPP